MAPASFTLTVASTWDGEPIDASERVRLRLRLGAGDLRIALAAPFHRDQPPPGAPGPTDRLWEHEVVELFVVGPADDAGRIPYTEVELSPWGHHLVLRLQGERKVLADRLPLRFRALRRAGWWLGAAALDLASLPPPPWRANAFAIHGSGAARRYLAAIPLPGDQPDFHQPSRFPALPLRFAE